MQANQDQEEGSCGLLRSCAGATLPSHEHLKCQLAGSWEAETRMRGDRWVFCSSQLEAEIVPQAQHFTSLHFFDLVDGMLPAAYGDPFDSPAAVC